MEAFENVRERSLALDNRWAMALLGGINIGDENLAEGAHAGWAEEGGGSLQTDVLVDLGKVTARSP